VGIFLLSEKVEAKNDNSKFKTIFLPGIAFNIQDTIMLIFLMMSYQF
jgi:hypothetical protein